MSISEQVPHALEDSATRLLHALRYEQQQGGPVPPLVVEFAGCPKAGKTSTIETVQSFFRRIGFTVEAPVEGASKRDLAHVRANLAHFNTATLSYTVQALLRAYHSPAKPDLILLDRGVYDSVAWSEMLHKNKMIKRREAENMRKFAMDRAPLISRLYLFMCAPEVSLRRERKLTIVDGVAMNSTMLTMMYDIYDALGTTLREQHSVTRIDTTHLPSELDTASMVVSDILAHGWLAKPSAAPRA